MTIQKIRSSRQAARMMCHTLFLLLLTAGTAGAQTLPALIVTSPANNSVVNPGTTVTLTIDSSPSGTAFSQIAITGPVFIGFNVIKPTSLPTQFSFPIPQDADCRVYTATVDGIPASGGDATPAQLQLDVEHSDAALGLSASLSSFTFQVPGEQSSVSFVGTFGNNIVADVTESTLMFYTSSDTNVATVDASSGRVLVTAVGPGSATITATYGQGATRFPLSIPVTVSPPLTASPPSLRFAGQPVATSSTQLTTTLLNSGQSAINVLGVNATGDFSQNNNCLSLSPLASGATCAINVTFTPTAAGARTGSINITDDANPASLTVSLAGTGIIDFSLSATPSTQTVTAGGSTSYTVSVSPIGGFNGTVALSVTGLPSGATANFSPTSIAGGSGSSTLTISTSSKTAAGNSALTITGTSGSLTHTAGVTLTVKSKR